MEKQGKFWEKSTEEQEEILDTWHISLMDWHISLEVMNLNW